MSKSMPTALRNLKRWYYNRPQKLFNTLPFQRKNGAWSPITKSLFIRSVIMDKYIPPLVFLKAGENIDNSGKNNIIYQIEDGQQRLLSLFEYTIDGEKDAEGKPIKGYALHSSTPSVKIEGVEYEIAGKRFSELHQDVQNELLNRNFNIALIEEYTDEEAEELFYLINSGVALSNIQKSKPKMGTKNVEFFAKLIDGSFFTLNTALSKKQAMDEDDLLTLIQASMLLDNEYNDREYTSIGAPAALEYATEIKKEYTEEQKNRLGRAINFLNKAFDEDGKIKFFNKNNIPIVIVIAEIASYYDTKPEDFREFIFDFAGVDGTDAPAEYKAGSGAGNVKSAKVLQRLLVMYTALRQYLGVSYDERFPFSKDIDIADINATIAVSVEEYKVSEQAKEETRKKKAEERARKKEAKKEVKKEAKKRNKAIESEEVEDSINVEGEEDSANIEGVEDSINAEGVEESTENEVTNNEEFAEPAEAESSSEEESNIEEVTEAEDSDEKVEDVGEAGEFSDVSSDDGVEEFSNVSSDDGVEEALTPEESDPQPNE